VDLGLESWRVHHLARTRRRRLEKPWSRGAWLVSFWHDCELSCIVYAFSCSRRMLATVAARTFAREIELMAQCRRNWIRFLELKVERAH
jgi:hypothetical protein